MVPGWWPVVQCNWRHYVRNRSTGGVGIHYDYNGNGSIEWSEEEVTRRPAPKKHRTGITFWHQGPRTADREARKTKSLSLRRACRCLVEKMADAALAVNPLPHHSPYGNGKPEHLGQEDRGEQPDQREDSKHQAAPAPSARDR